MWLKLGWGAQTRVVVGGSQKVMESGCILKAESNPSSPAEMSDLSGVNI